ncbi:MAG: beta-ketoacyl synthase N-terminal-like domain-containing protein [Segniliparus sp.]|uniref:beta-ketoacyl synthase N-terminal-like domain-containing protein n=1 Tax=Segniliparus sp. TaxID=2804064 RepID=UPI003F3FC485
MSPSLSVGLSSPGLYTAAGVGVENLWEALLAGKRDSTPNEFRLGAWSDLVETFTVPDPDAETLAMHRKALRTTEKQARLAIYGAQLALRELADVGGPQWGLYLGLPGVDKEWLQLANAPQLQAVAQEPAQVAALYLRETSPFNVLMRLNSTAAAHISILFGLTGSTAIHSPFSDAGLEALIDGALAVAESDCAAALIGAASPSLSPQLALQYEELGWNGAVPGEASAFLVAGRGEEVVLSGYSRGFASGAARSQAVADVLSDALRMAQIPAEDVGWVLADSTWTDEAAHAQREAIAEVLGDSAPVFSAERAIGVAGPAQPLVHALLAWHGLSHGLRLVPADDEDSAAPPREEALPGGKAAVVLGLGVRGQACAVVLTGGPA